MLDRGGRIASLPHGVLSPCSLSACVIFLFSL